MPLVGVVELVLHAKQTSSDIVTDDQWVAARDAVRSEAKPGDLVVFTPFWADPLGRRFFGNELAGIKGEARPDVSRFPRAFEVSIRGFHDDELAHWRKVSERKVGPVSIGLYENPAPVKILTDLLERVGPEKMTVAKVDGDKEQACTWSKGAGQPGGLGVPQGPAIPGDKFNCPSGGYVGAAVLHALDHHPHLCLFVSSNSGTVKIRFADVDFGEALHGHAGVQWVTDRTPSADEKTKLAFSAFDRPIGQHAHRIGTGWVPFEFPTPDIAGKRGELEVEVTGSGQRQFCFEADTR